MTASPSLRRFVMALILFTAFTAAPGCSSDPTAELKATLDRAVNKAASDSHLTGAIVGLSIPGSMDFVRTLGVSDTKTKRPLSVDDHFRIGSVTKLFTGTAVLQFVDQGRIRLTDPISRYVDGVPSGDHITIDMLGRMRSGLFDYMADDKFLERYLDEVRRGPDAAAFTPRELLDVAFAHPLRFAPGTKTEYSNTNFVLLGLAVERVTGQPFGEYLRQNILAPMGLSGTSYPRNGVLPERYAHGYSSAPEGDVVDTSSWNPAVAAAAGQMVSTFTDLKTWLPAVARGALLAASTHADRLSRATELATGTSYAFAITDFNGWIGHDGEIPGYITIAAYLPQRDATLVLLANSDADAGAVAQLATAVTSAVSPNHVISPRA
jgi:D-alanyl-D-alanine carboxypeptidase